MAETRHDTEHETRHETRHDTERISEAAGALRRVLEGLEPSVYGASDAATLADELSWTEKACAAARLLLAARAVACGAHKDAGVADPARWVAHQAGTTRRQAKDALMTAASLPSCPATKEALLAGKVSILQAHEIAKAQEELPGTEADLVEVACSGDLSVLRDEVRERRLRAVSATQLHDRQVATRRFRHWRDGLGMVCFEGALPPETGIPMVTRIERDAACRHRTARRQGTFERFEAHAADALVALIPAGGARGEGGPDHGAGGHGAGEKKAGSMTRASGTDLVIVCDLYAWRRGHAHENEPCHLVGGGPIPVELARQLAADAFVKAVLHDGVDIQRVRHLGRRLTAHLRTALDLGPVPRFTGRACVDCGRTFGLERDHVDPVAHTGTTCISNLADRCYPCHADKTERDRRAGLLGRRARARGPGPP
ncbi:MAG: HNH endonuclease signature motif containing protein [Actinomycetota bacterium]|nr:HNH endonuclease signature motif containing protein [Actinomycetota bacterium]